MGFPEGTTILASVNRVVGSNARKKCRVGDGSTLRLNRKVVFLQVSHFEGLGPGSHLGDRRLRPTCGSVGPLIRCAEWRNHLLVGCQQIRIISFVSVFGW